MSKELLILWIKTGGLLEKYRENIASDSIFVYQ